MWPSPTTQNVEEKTPTRYKTFIRIYHILFMQLFVFPKACFKAFSTPLATINSILRELSHKILAMSCFLIVELPNPLKSRSLEVNDSYDTVCHVVK